MLRTKSIAIVTIVAALAISLLVSSCSNENPAESSEQETIISGNVTALGESSAVELDSTDGVNYYFSVGGDVPHLNPGDIIVGTDNSGFLRRVSAVSQEGSLLSITTGDAVLTDAFVKCSLQATVPLTLDDAMNKAVTEPAKGGYKMEGVSITEEGIDLSGVTLFSDENNTVRISGGYVNFEPVLDLGFEIEDRVLKEFHAIGSGELNSSLDIIASCGSIGLSGDTILAEIPVGKTVVWVEYVPVVITSTLRFRAGYAVEASVLALQAGYEGSISVACGASYENSEWTTVWEKTLNCAAHDCDWIESPNTQVKVYIRPEIDVEIYAVAGPNLGVEGYLEYCGEVDGQQWSWTLSGGIAGYLGIRVHILSWDLVDRSWELVKWETTLAADTGEVSGPLIISEQDFTGDGTLDIRADNGVMWIQINRDQVQQAGRFIDAGGMSGKESFLRNFIQAGGLVDGVAYWSTRNFDVDVLENSAQTGTYRVTAIDTANGKEVTKVFTVTLNAGEESASIGYDFTNTGDASWSYDHPLSHIHDGAALANVTSSETLDIDAYINGVGLIGLSSTGLWRSYTPDNEAPFAVLFEPSSSEAVTYGFDGLSEHPMNQIVSYYTGLTSEITPTLDFQAAEFTLSPGASTQWRALIAFHTGGDTKGIEIYNNATW